MKQVEVVGIILSTMPVGEYDSRVCLLTKEKGKITAFARGARRVNNKFMGSVRMFSFGKFSLYPGRNSYTLTDAKITEHFESLLSDLDKISYASYFVEVAEFYSKEELDCTETLSLLYVTLKNVCKGQISYKLIRSIYELKMLVINGEYPNVYACSECNKKENLVAFSKRDNGVLCSEHIITSAVKISNTCLYTMQYIISANITKLYSFNLKDEYIDEVTNLICDYFKSKAEVKFRTLSMIEGL